MSSLEGEEESKTLMVNGHSLNPMFQRNRFYARWTRSVFCGNLNWNAEEWHVEEYMQDCGEVLNVRFFRDQSGRSKGQCLVEFLTRGATMRALEKDQSEFLGRTINVRLANKPVRRQP